MKKIALFAAILFVGSFAMYSCKSGHSGGCDAYGGSGSLPVKEVGKSL
jgi:hypothetical protein